MSPYDQAQLPLNSGFPLISLHALAIEKPAPILLAKKEVSMNDIRCRKDIQLLVETFYQNVRRDSLLGPVFNDVADVKWESHIPIVVQFWESLLLKTDRYRRNALQPHINIFQKISYSPEMMANWLTLFDLTINHYFQSETADKAKHWARGIAHNLQKQIYRQCNITPLK